MTGLQSIVLQKYRLILVDYESANEIMGTKIIDSDHISIIMSSKNIISDTVSKVCDHISIIMGGGIWSSLQNEP